MYMYIIYVFYVYKLYILYLTKGEKSKNEEIWKSNTQHKLIAYFLKIFIYFYISFLYLFLPFYTYKNIKYSLTIFSYI